jgi:hypothetical protein
MLVNQSISSGGAGGRRAFYLYPPSISFKNSIHQVYLHIFSAGEVDLV